MVEISNDREHLETIHIVLFERFFSHLFITKFTKQILITEP